MYGRKIKNRTIHYTGLTFLSTCSEMIAQWALNYT
jgi:hypothetical protein